MSISDELKDHRFSNVTFCCPIWKMAAKDGTVAAYCAHTRQLVFDSVTYKVSSVESTRPMEKIGLQPNSVEVTGIFDDIVTRANLEAGKWSGAFMRYEEVNYLDLTMGSTGIIEGTVGKVAALNEIAYKLEFLSKSDALQQLLGELTSPVDRNAFPAGVDVEDYTFAAEITNVTSNRKFKVDHVPVIAAPYKENYFRYGVVRFTSGANIGQEMEVKISTTTDTNTKTEIEVQLPFSGVIAIGDDVELIAGYDGSRDQLRDKFGDMEDGNMEPDLPGMKAVLRYPE